MRIPIAKQGFPFILFFAALTGVALLAGFPLAAGLIFFLTLFVIFFFRDPERKAPEDEHLIVSPADGKLIQIRQIPAGEVLAEPAVCLSVFMSPFNVHVNRMPFQGKILKKIYNPGKFLPAYRQKASLLNEQVSVLVDTDGGPIRMTQIAGRLARRIVCWAQEGDTLARGERFGMIKFGSRVDLCLPRENTVIVIRLGDRVKAGETVLARFSSLSPRLNKHDE
ncbi:MAG: phosphatidylserine decarboxylase family protein [bacterium]|nr:phosphatidylserine decarboxylase family protein [bacterium]